MEKISSFEVPTLVSVPLSGRWINGVIWCMVLPLLLGCPMLLTSAAQGIADDGALNKEIRPARPRPQSQSAFPASARFNHPIQANGRPDPLAQAISQAFTRNDTNEAARLLGQFTGDVNELRFFGGEPLLVFTARQGNLALVNLLLDRKANPNQASSFGGTALLAAIQRTAWPIALRLIDAGADVSSTITNAPGRAAPLEEIINMWWTGRPDHELQVQVLQEMLNHGADPFSPSMHHPNGSILEAALFRNDGTLGDLLLTNHPSPARRTSAGDTALHLAVKWGRTNAVDFLLSAGFSINQTNNEGLTPLQSVVGSSAEQRFGFAGQFVGLFGPGLIPSPPPVRSLPLRGVRGTPVQPSIAELLLSRGATLDIWSAAGLGKTNELSTLLAANPALINARDGLGRTPLHYAAFASETAAAKLLIRAGADVSVLTTKPILERSRPIVTTGSSPLHLASRRGNAELIRLLLRSGAAIGQPDGEGDTPLHHAARQWQTNALRILVNAHSPLNATNRAGHTALRAAVETGVGPNVELLLKAGAQLKIGSETETLIHVAAERGSVEIINILLQHGLKLDARDSKGRTPFMLAVDAKQWGAMNLLLAKGSDINTVDTNGDTALHLLSVQNLDTAGHQIELPWLARQESDWLMHPGFRHNTITNLVNWRIISQPAGPGWTNTSVTAWLLKHHAKPDLANHEGQTPLNLLCAQQWIAYQQSEATNRVALLLNAGAKVNAPDSHGLTPLHVAIDHASADVLSLLIKHAGKLDQLSDKSGQTLLHLAVTNHQFESAKTVQLLLENHANPNARDRLGRTPLNLFIQAAQSGDYQVHVEVVDALIKAGADASLRDNEGQTFLHEWCKQGRSHWSNLDEVIRKLLAQHSDLLKMTNAAGDTPLHTALRSDNSTAVRLLLEYGADLLIHDARGETALYLAQKDDGGRLANMVHPKGTSYNFYFSMATRNQADFELFLKTEPNLANITFNNGQTALMAATRLGAPKEFAARLLELGARLDPISALRLGRVEDARRLLGGSTNLSSSIWFETVDLRQFEEIKDLAEKRGDLQALDKDGHTLFYHAAISGQTNTAGWLRDHGVKPNFFDAVGLGDTNYLGVVLATNQSFANASYTHDQTVLMFAATMRQRGSVRVLIDHGAKIDAENPQGWNALHVACVSGATEVVEELLRAGARPDVREPNGLAPLHLAAAGGANGTVRLLLDHGTDVNLPQTQPANYYQTLSAGSTPLHWAALCNRLEVIKLLLQSGADVNATNTAGETPLDLVGINPSVYQGIPGPLRAGYYSMANRGPKLWTQTETELKQAGGVRKCTAPISTGYERIRGK